MNTAKNIVTRYDHEHDVLVISNPFYEQLTKSVRRQLELYIFEYFLFLYVYGHIHMFHALQETMCLCTNNCVDNEWEISEIQCEK